MIYGATGFTGQLIVEICKQKNLTPTLAGRNPEKTKILADKYGLEWKSFGLENPSIVAKQIQDYELVLHCAGPFIETAEPMAEACIATNTHYLDITGEIPVYELLYNKHEKAKSQKVLLLPGVGFDIVPTDCVAMQIKRWLPDATELCLGFMGLSSISKGTAKSALAQAPYGSVIRKDGKLTRIPQFSLKREFKIMGRKKTLYSIPWGDVFTAYISTGIPNVSVYTYVPNEVLKMSWVMNLFSPMLKNKPILHAAQNLIDLFVKGPDENLRQRGFSYVVGYGKNAEGKEVEIEIRTKEGYQFTAESAVLAVQKILEQSVQIPGGFSTPSLTFGADFVYEIPGTVAQN